MFKLHELVKLPNGRTVLGAPLQKVRLWSDFTVRQNWPSRFLIPDAEMYVCLNTKCNYEFMGDPVTTPGSYCPICKGPITTTGHVQA